MFCEFNIIIPERLRRNLFLVKLKAEVLYRYFRNILTIATDSENKCYFDRTLSVGASAKRETSLQRSIHLNFFFFLTGGRRIFEISLT